jgi:hypothetical protein
MAKENPDNQEQQGDQHAPTGTSGRQSGNDMGDNPDARRRDQTTPSGGRRPIRHDDEESGLGNRTTNR